ncbi:MAG: hypothetical protein QXQ46_04525 [Thermoplasmatales archaeon]
MIEVEDPLAIPERKNSLPFWANLDFRLICVDYTQPSLSEGKEPSRNLLLLVKNLNGSSYLDVSSFLSLLKDYFRYAMGKKNPDDINEFKRIRDAVISEPYLTLRRISPFLFDGVTLYYFLTLDVDMLANDPQEFRNELISFLQSGKERLNFINYGALDGYNRLHSTSASPFIFAMYLQNSVNFSTSYLNRRSVIRFSRQQWENEKVVVTFNSIPGREYRVSLSTYYVYNSIGVLSVELAFPFQGLILPELIIELVERSRLKINGVSVDSFMKSKLEYILKYFDADSVRLGTYDISRQMYPLIVSSSYVGTMDSKTLYGIFNGDPSYELVSKHEIEEATGPTVESENISIVGAALTYYKFNSSLVIFKSEESMFNSVEEITGYTLPDLIAKWKGAGFNLEVRDMIRNSVEAEYVTEIELLRAQFSILLWITDRYTDKAISYKLTKEQTRLTEEEEKIERRMVEINLIDVEHFTSLKIALQSAQRQMGIIELKERATQLRNTLYRETSTFFELTQARKSNILNFLVAILIIGTSLVAVINSLGYSHISLYIEVVSMVSAFVLLVLYAIPMRPRNVGRISRK